MLRLMIFSILLASSAVEAQKTFLYVGTYTQNGSIGIYIYEYKARSGALTPVGTAGQLQNPSFLTLSPDQKFLYAVQEIDAGLVSAFKITPESGQLTRLNDQPVKGIWPCHLQVDRTGRWLIVGNYGSGNLSVLPINPDGSLQPVSQTLQHTGHGPHLQRQEKAHVHSINIDRDNRFVIVADLGIDQLVAYSLDNQYGRLSPAKIPFTPVTSGAGPRHFAWHPHGQFAYGIMELNSTITVFNYKPGQLTPIQTISTLPGDFAGENTCADIHLSPDGKFLYGSNRGHHSIAIFAVHSKNGHLTALGHQSVLGETPRNFALDPQGRFLLVANQNTDNIQVFKRHKKTGLLTYTGQEIKVSRPVCLVFRP